MELDIIGSSSRGNCYILQNEDEALIIEMGCKFQEVLKVTNYRRSKIVGAIITHNHSDHARNVKELQDWNIPCFAPADVSGSHLLAGNGRRTSFGGFKIHAFSVKHNVECYGYLISHKDIGKLLFITDAKEIPYSFSNLNHIMCEANYDYYLYEKYPERRHGNTNHMEIEDAITGIGNQDLSKVKDIILLHLSDGLSNAEDFKRRMEEATGIPTTIADSGMKIELK